MLVKRLLPMQRSSCRPKMLVAVFLAFLIFALALPHLAFAQGTQDYGLTAVKNWGIFGESNLMVFIGKIIEVFLGMLGVVASLLIMYSGFVWMTASGDPNKVVTAKKIMTNAIIGLIIIFMAFALTAFILSMLSNVSQQGGGPGNYPGGPLDPYRSAIGYGPIESVYPAPNATNININTWIAVTFKEPIRWDSVSQLDQNHYILKNIEICEISSTSSLCLPGTTAEPFTVSDFASSSVTTTADFKTIVINTNKYLGNDDSRKRTFKVKLLQGINASSTGKSIFGANFGYYEWAFQTNGQLDLDPPEIISSNADMLGVYPMPDNLIDSYANYQAAAAGQATATISSLPDINSPTMINGVAFDKQAEVEITSTMANIPSTFKVLAKTTSGFEPAITADVSVQMAISNDGTYAIFNNDADNLGFAYKTDNECSGLSRCLPVKTSTNIDTGNGLFIESNGPLPPGSLWQIYVKAPHVGDTFTINSTAAASTTFVFVGNDDNRDPIKVTQIIGGIASNIYYKAVKVSSTVSGAAYDLAATINMSPASPDVEANSISNMVVLKAKTSGATDISISKNSNNITLAPTSGNLSGGQAAQVGRIKNGNQDAYNNTIFQINFNEAINPAFVKDENIVIKYLDRNGNVTQVYGSTTVSNEYSTIEVRGPHECGVNSCGDKIYCWLDPAQYPATDTTSTKFSVEVAAASLKTCSAGDNAWCTQTYGGTCEANQSGRCYRDSNGARVYYPQVNVSNVDGIIDMSGNSFNGSFNTTTITDLTSGYTSAVGIAEGKSNEATSNGGSNHDDYRITTSTYPIASSTVGDNFYWSFYLSNEIDNQPPLLKTIDPTGDYDYGYESSEDFSRPVWLAFDRLMYFSSLRPGWGYDSVKNSKAWNNRFLALTTLTKGANPVGFWISGNNIDEDGDHQADYTLGGIEHNLFDRSVRYAPLAGSGILSITQNCFLPSRGPADAGSGQCRYINGNLSGCVSSTLPNPASYAKLNCDEIDGAHFCLAAQDCGPLYPNAPTSSGSWIITRDHPVITATRTDCCLGVCR